MTRAYYPTKVVRWLLQSNHPAVHVITLTSLRTDKVIVILKETPARWVLAGGRILLVFVR